MNMHQSRILIIDFGSQYAQLIARRVRECGVYCELMHPDITAEAMRAFNPSGIILSGGPETVIEHHTPRAPNVIFELNVPILGICYGMQTMAQQLGGAVASSDHREFGLAQCELDLKTPLFQGVNANEFVASDSESETDNCSLSVPVWMSHGDHVTQIPPGFKVIAKTNNAPIAAMCDESRQWYAVQFHPEVTHTKNGMQMLDNFVKQICHCESTWNVKNIIADSLVHIREKVGKEKVLLALSGGVDSSVLAALLHEAIGDQLICVFVDTGLMRKNEGDHVMKIFADNLGVKVIRVNAQDLFLSKLKNVVEPEAKRKLIGNLFIDVFEKESEKLQGITFLAQGTIYPDVIESGQASSGTAHVIKSHHNVGGLPDNMKFKLIEPLRELFKDEVRALGMQLGLPKTMVYRHPFPGVGLGIRILGEVKKEFIPILQDADDIFIHALREHHLYDQVAQAFAVFLPVKSVGVKGDARCYDYVIALRAVVTTDFMTAEWAELPHAFLAYVSNKILNEIKNVSRVVYDISGKPPATIEWE
ncbi:MAG: glutamine-hydrolyzing GMP synthase [Gammaproteobacteria bacterium CG_4_10_14_0_8_um_filter_38_16]|nr:MAG: glutamine-hydrolyzing GMP synthase [Gammaproteobacteria bacterium CG_4_10_14_0_8_um_filter_38_16]PJA03725.1 MAG: glutamine-hydrolyzing GMP synthase [Gammaproteobacteria bacterium CG_4_10_14_0_2_um_filter_38_22]PJB09912.1 MAG: glutamine-hydrolyzing GMP synthase [Gammaproteobacteria bacterium CG_4_9_14_3_um_filter_38_9]